MHKCFCCEWTRRSGPIGLGGTLASKSQPKSHIGKHFCPLSTNCAYAHKHIKTKKMPKMTLPIVHSQKKVNCRSFSNDN